MTKKTLGIKLIKPSDFYNLENKRQTAYVERVKRWIDSSNNNVLKTMSNIVKRNLKAYYNDFYIHDFYTLLVNDKVKKYIWFTRNTGTDLVPLYCDNQFNNAYMWYQAVKTANNNYYLIDLEHNKVQKISLQKADKIINDHKDKLNIDVLSAV